MKRIVFYLGIATALVASCSTKEKDFQTPPQDEVMFYASFEQPIEDETRVYANEDLLLRWTADDRVTIFNKNTYNQQYRFTGETGDNAGGFEKIDGAEFVTGNPISHTVSVYPYQEGTKVSEDEVLTLTLPAEQHYAENTFGLGSNTMVAVSEDNFLQYKNVGGYLRLSLYGDGVSVSSITLKGNNGEKLAGKATVTKSLNGAPTVTLVGDLIDEITLVCNTPVALGATIEESKDFWFVVPPLTFSKGLTIKIEESEGRVVVESTSKSVSIERSKLSKMSPTEVYFIPVPDAVDLGLPSGLKWASFNLGASKPEEYGDYYAWGETEPYYISQDPLIWKEGKESGYDWASYKWCMGSQNTLTKYCPEPSSYGYNGFIDTKTLLDLEDDAAHINLGGNWRIPAHSEFTELWNNCTWKWISMNGISGRKVSGPNGNSIFLPAAGGCYHTSHDSAGYSAGFYWSSSLYTDNPIYAKGVNFGSGDVGIGSADARFYGRSVRPVCD